MIMSTMMNVYKNIILDLCNEYVKHNIECIANTVVQFHINTPITIVSRLIYYWLVPIAM